MAQNILEKKIETQQSDESRGEFELSRRSFIKLLGAGLLITVTEGVSLGRRRGGGQSISVAAPRRTAGTVEGVVRLPAVLPSSGTRAVSAMIRRIRSAVTCSSSAAACVS